MFYCQGMASEAKRPYDASRRRERADQERSATRLRVVEAARRLFLSRGYVATTMADVAREAGVALQSVYKAGGSKAELLRQVADFAVTGDDQQGRLLDRPQYAAIARESDPRRQVEMMAAVFAQTVERLAPVWLAYREAAAVEPKAAADLVAAHALGHRTIAGMISMLPEDRLRRSPEDSTDTLWA